MDKKIFRCKNCLNVSTRDRVEFDERGFCNACQWVEEKKKKVDWKSRWNELEEICEQHRGQGDGFDCIVPVSGGKDGSYVSYMLKHKLGMNPLAVTIRVPLSDPLGDENLTNFIDSGYSHVLLSPNMEIMREMNINGFKKFGRPMVGWQTFVHSAIRRLAIQYKIPLIFFGENGDVEYGGSSESKNTPLVDVSFSKNTYLSGTYDEILPIDKFSEKEIFWATFPSEEEIEKHEVKYLHWSYFENWDPYEHYLVAKEHCGLLEKENGNDGTYTNFAQTDSVLYSLHTYLMYIKLGFNRCTQDCGIDIRRGAMTREQGLQLVRIYDNHYPSEFMGEFLKYYKMTQDEFDLIIDRHANKDIFEKINSRWMPKYEIE